MKKCIWSETGIHTQYFIKDDGGRIKAGFKGYTGDCACRAISIATGKPYKEIYDLINKFSKEEKTSRTRVGKSNARTGVHKHTFRKVMENLGWTWTPCMKVGVGCKVHLRGDELPSGRIICNVSKHYVAVIDGTIHDEYDCSRKGTRCVYGYHIKK